MTKRNNGRRNAARLWRRYAKMARLTDSPEEKAAIDAMLDATGEAFHKTLEKQREIHHALRTTFLAQCDKAWKMGRSKRDIKRIRDRLDRAEATLELLTESVAQQFIGEIGDVCELWAEMRNKPIKK